MLGGISRRATVIDEAGATPKLIIDAGNFSASNKNEFYRYKTEALIESYMAMGYDAIAIGPSEITQGKDYILKLNDLSGGRLVCANVIDGDGNLIVQPYITRDFGSLRVGIVGLAYHQMNLGRTPDGSKPEILTREPALALKEILPVMKEKDHCDVIIVAGILQPRNLEELAKEFDGQIDIVLSGNGYTTKERRGGYLTYFQAPEQEGPSDTAPVVVRDEANKRESSIIYHKNGQSGKYLGKLHCVIGPREGGGYKVTKFEGSTIELDDKIPFSPVIEDILAAFHQRIKDAGDLVRRDVLNQKALHYWQDFPQYIGSRSCSECHQKATNFWNMSDHSRSIQTLTLEREDKNDECLKCHVTGFNEPEGYIDRIETFHLANIGCEACHGPARDHIGIELELKDARKMNGQKMATEEQVALLEETKGGYDHKIRKSVPEPICISCHDSEWDPEFNYEEDVKVVNHTGPNMQDNPEMFPAEELPEGTRLDTGISADH